MRHAVITRCQITIKLYCAFFSFAPGCVIGVEGWENITKNPRILASEIFIKLGDTISPITSDANRHGFFILEGSSDDAEAILDTVKVNYA